MGAVVQVRGLREVTSALRAVDKELPKGLREEFLPIARRVADDASSRVPRRSGDAAGSVKPRASQRGAGIAFGGNAAPYFPWLDFGGTTGKGHRPGVGGSGSVERDWLGRPRGEGRYVYPAIRDNEDGIIQAAGDAPVNLARKHGLEAR